MKKKYTYEDLLHIIETLRSENGCPWDREQTHKSLRPCMMEEAAEVVAAIRILEQTNNAENLQEELGDVLLQVVMHAQIGKEEGLFSMEDVVNDVAEKMVRRHPHVFGEIQADTSDQVLRNWEDIKKKEKEGKNWIESPLKEVPMELPALTRACKVLKKADKYYGKSTGLEKDIEILRESLKEMEIQGTDCQTDQLAITMGNMLMAISDIARLHKLPLEQILSDKVDDYIEYCEGTAKN